MSPAARTAQAAPSIAPAIPVAARGYSVTWTVSAVIPVEIPRPRDRVSVIDDPHFRDVQTELLALLYRDQAREVEGAVA